ncbi:MAG: hypothetical protein HQM03_08025 [Magnetococcales bacterium]|nr:hypothetical protein [Magnetococcales bacterium]
MNLQAIVHDLSEVMSAGGTLPVNPAIAKVVRHLSDSMLAACFGSHGVQLKTLDSIPGGSARARTQKILEEIGQLDDDLLGRMGTDAERFVEMADDLGQEAMQSVVIDRKGFVEQESAIARGIWLHLHEPESFRRAVEIRHADRYRLGRTWDGFVGPKRVAVSADPEHRREFGEWIKNWFRSPQVKVEVYERIRPKHKGGKSRLVQVVVYREGLPDSILEFENGDLARRHLRPVHEFSLTYEADSGVIEVIAQDRASREEMARAFANTLLRQEIASTRVPLREFDLRPLMSPHAFATDPEDGVKGVEVISLTLQPMLDGAEQITFDADRQTGRSLYERLFEWFREHNPLTTGFRIQKAILSVRFYPDAGFGRGKTVPVKLSLPNGCNLKSKTEKERLVCEKYLPLWGLVREV